VVSIFLCPSSVRSPGDGRDGNDPNDPITTAYGRGYGVADYGATCYTDIDPLGRSGADASIISGIHRYVTSGRSGKNRTRSASLQRPGRLSVGRWYGWCWGVVWRVRVE